MGTMAKNSVSDYVPPPADIYRAVCVGIYDLGTQENRFGAPKPQVSIMWEIDCRKDDGKRHTVSMRVTPSVHKKSNFRKILESWSGRTVTEQEERDGFAMSKLLGQPCQLQIVHNQRDGKTYANVNTVIKLGPGQEPLKPESKMIAYDWDKHGKTIPEGVPEFIQKAIKESLEWRGEMPPAKEPEKQKEPSLAEQGAGIF